MIYGTLLIHNIYTGWFCCTDYIIKWFCCTNSFTINNNNNDFISIALFHVKHAQLYWTIQMNHTHACTHACIHTRIYTHMHCMTLWNPPISDTLKTAATATKCLLSAKYWIIVCTTLSSVHGIFQNHHTHSMIAGTHLQNTHLFFVLPNVQNTDLA